MLGLCARANLVPARVIATDGTKIAPNASGAKNIIEDRLKDFANRVFREAEEIDAGEDAL